MAVEKGKSSKTLFTETKNYLTDKHVIFLHVGVYVMALLIGIARYSRSIPQGLIILTAIWSIALLIHGVLVYRAQTAKDARTVPRDGILNAALAFTTVNGLMWLMWMLATDGRDPGVWHVSFMLALLMIGVMGVIAGKRALYRHWLQEYLRNSGEPPGETKLKRERLITLDDEGEYDTMWISKDDQERRSSNSG